MWFQVASTIDEQTLGIVGEVFFEGFKILFNEAQQKLMKSIELMDQRAREQVSGQPPNSQHSRWAVEALKIFTKGWELVLV